ncbi:MAG: pantetheine-phosphate adenylyltransferase [Vicingus serpentipes]|nr:pantetheine-phosphate adenylyltransferase [Vicingus serpentipes]
MKIAVFPGSFDPITKGHEDIIKRGTSLFDKIIIGIGTNTAKKYLFTIEERIQWIKATFADNEKIEVAQYNGLTVDFCKKMKADYILRGLRSSADYSYEAPIGQMNKSLDKQIETIYLLTSPELAAINSTIVRDIIINGGDASQFVPSAIQQNLLK